MILFILKWLGIAVLVVLVVENVPAVGEAIGTVIGALFDGVGAIADGVSKEV